MFLVVGIILSILILLFSGSIMITSATVLLKYLDLCFCPFILIACMSAMGLLTSVLSYRPNTSLLIGLMIWLVFLFVILHTTLLLSNKLFPVESTEYISKNSENTVKRSRQVFLMVNGQSNSSKPFMPAHKIRAEMQMEFMLGEKKIKDNWYNSQFTQYEKTSKLTQISPMFIFEIGNENISSTGGSGDLRTTGMVSKPTHRSLLGLV